ncbi:DUF4388 domain-containing protein [Thermus tengchongensis]|uniref:DUF4388 domain-containing protein n=1 Tax=Thermus tengchongensis TaxID=1214928 RepID=A0A4Y9FF62_9DEIN|nr:DUF4388 domain-containing protein [Thermus tengchongensis]TFU27777.1 DUF4388 domain-containing protein [Thermus tengchongensis]
MALFGSLDSLPLEELLQLLAHKEGALEIWNLKGIPPTTIYLKPGHIRSLDQNGKPLDPMAAKATLQALLQAREGSFEFLPGAKPKHKVRLGWPVEKVLLSIITLQDELDRYRPHLPHPEARFELAGSSPEDPRFKDFFRLALPYLKRGVSPQELAQALRLPLDQVRFYLYRLQLLGAVKRAAPRPKAHPLAGKLLAHLKALWSR